MNILMIYPEIPTTYWSLRHALPFINKKAGMPPLGLITVAALLPPHFQATLVDLNIQQLKIEEIKKADLVFISAMIVQRESFASIAKICKENGAVVVAGGPYPTTSYQEIQDVDYFVLNEAEITLPLFLHDFMNGQAKKIYMDIAKPELTISPTPRFELLDVNAYAVMTIQSSRGCPFNCEFCDIIEMYGRKPRYKKNSQVLAEFDAVLRTSYKGALFLVDDNFIGNKRKVKELLKEIIIWQKKNDYPFALFTEASINLAKDDELMDLMVEAGMDMVFIGIETPDEASLNKTQKSHNAAMDLKESVKKIQKKGIEVMAGFILGFDDEPQDIFEKQINFIQDTSIPLAMIGLMMVLPNTQLFRRLQREGRILKSTNGNNTHNLDMNFVPTLPKDTLIAGYKKVINFLYSPKNYFRRSLNLFKIFPKNRFIVLVNQNKQKNWKAFFKSLFRQSFSRYGITYLIYIVRIFWFHRNEISEAVTLAVKGHHFFRITKDIMKIDRFLSMLNKRLQTLEEKLANSSRQGLSRAVMQFERTKKKIQSRLQSLEDELKGTIFPKYLEFEKQSQQLIAGYSSQRDDIGKFSSEMK